MPPVVMLPKRLAAITSRMKRFSREKETERAFQEAFRKSQAKESSEMTDVKLVCDGGTIAVHAILLTAVSPLFAAVVESQGDSYLLTRDILMPDYSLEMMQKVIQLIYIGSVFVESNDEADSLKELLIDLQIKNLDNIVIKKMTKKADSRQPEIRVKKQAKLKKEPKDKDSETVDLSSDEEVSKEPDPVSPKGVALPDGEEKKERRTRSGRRTRNYNDSDYEPTTDEESEGSRDRKSRTRSTSRKPEEGQAAKRSNSQDKAAITGTPAKNGEKSDKKATKPPRAMTEDSDNEVPWREPNYNDKKWFDREAKKCQYRKCLQVHETPALASMCITGHQRLRCYFCFRVCKNTEKLFDHFKNQHKQAGRDNSLLCPYCEQTIPYKSVSCHVISLHLSGLNSKMEPPSTRKPTAPPTPVAYRPRPGLSRHASVGAPTPSKTLERKRSSSARPEFTSSKTKSKAAAKEKEARDAKKRSLRSQKDPEEKEKPQPKKRKISDDEDDVLQRINDKDEDGMLRVGDLDCTIRRKGLDGQIWVWRIQKPQTAEIG